MFGIARKWILDLTTEFSKFNGKWIVQRRNSTLTALNYQLFKYKENEVSKILHVINTNCPDTLNSYDLSKSRIQKINLWKTKNGSFKNLEQILELDGFGVKVVEKFANSILKERSTITNDQKLKNDAVKKPSSFQSTIPALLEKNRSSIKSCISIHTGISSVSWSQLHLLENERTIQLNEWNLYNMGDSKLHLNDLIQHCSYVNYLIPEADVYILENPQTAQPGAQNSAAQININIQKSQLIAMISMILASRQLNTKLYQKFDSIVGEQDVIPIVAMKSNPPVFYMKSNITPRLFGTLVGSERVNNSEIIGKLFRIKYNIAEQINVDANSNSKSLKTEFQLNIEKLPKEMYMAAEGFHKEYMGNALLLGLAFLRLCVLREEKSISIVNSAMKK